MRLDEKISSVAFGRPKSESDKNVPRIRVCVLGSSAVGKTGEFSIPAHCNVAGRKPIDSSVARAASTMRFSTVSRPEQPPRFGMRIEYNVRSSRSLGINARLLFSLALRSHGAERRRS